LGGEVRRGGSTLEGGAVGFAEVGEQLGEDAFDVAELVGLEGDVGGFL